MRRHQQISEIVIHSPDAPFSGTQPGACQHDTAHNYVTRLVYRTSLRDSSVVNGAELAKKLKRLAKQRDLEFEYEPRHGKGSHGHLLFGDKLTTVKDRGKKEIGPGLLHDIPKQLGLTKEGLS